MNGVLWVRILGIYIVSEYSAFIFQNLVSRPTLRGKNSQQIVWITSNVKRLNQFIGRFFRGMNQSGGDKLISTFSKEHFIAVNTSTRKINLSKQYSMDSLTNLRRQYLLSAFIYFVFDQLATVTHSDAFFHGCYVFSRTDMSLRNHL